MKLARPLLVAALVTGFGVAAGDAQEPRPRYERRWVYAPQNLLVVKNVDEVVALIERAARAGYNGIMLADYKFNILDRMPPNYTQNVERVREAAEKANVELIPAVFPVGYSDGLLAHDPNLAEGLAVRDAPFVVRGHDAVPEPPSSALLRNGNLEDARGDRFGAFSSQDDPGKATFADHAVVHGGTTSCRIQDVARTSASGNGRLIQRVKVRPHTCYRFSCWARTRDLSNPGSFRLLTIGAGPKGRPLTFFEGGLRASEDWKPLDVVFNTLEQTDVNVYVGLWGGGTGTLWVDDLKLEEVSLVNVLRRDGCPLSVASADGKTTFEEGRDFEPVRDAKLGRVPYEGLYSFDHAGARIRLTAGSRIKDGASLRVSWYHPVLTHGSQMMCCLSDPKVYELLRDQARRVNDLLHPRTFFMSHDEIRVANWCLACRRRGLTPGALLADNVRRCTEILKEISPAAKIVVWSDMFDPHHNAVDGYYLVNGTLDGSWKGLTPDVIVANWNSGKARDSLRWFAGRGHRQIIAGYYDGNDLGNFRTWDAAAQGVRGIDGFMYTTWEHKYRLLELYGDATAGRRRDGR